MCDDGTSSYRRSQWVNFNIIYMLYVIVRPVGIVRLRTKGHGVGIIVCSLPLITLVR
jgi:hypothetical protein